MIRYCLADIAKGLFNGMIANYLLYFFQPTDKSGLPLLLPQYKLFGFITIMALLTALGKIIDAISDPIVAYLSDRSPNKNGRRLPFMKKAAVPYALSVLLIFFAPFKDGSVFNTIWVGIFLLSYYVSYTFYFIPRNALVPEIITDSKKIVTYYGISTAFFMVSSSFMYAATLFVDLLKKGGLTPLEAWRVIFTIFAIIGVVCLLMGVFVAFPFASINILPQSVLSDIIQEDSIVNKVNREGIFSALKTFSEKIAGSIALMFVSSILAIGAT